MEYLNYITEYMNEQMFFLENAQISISFLSMSGSTFHGRIERKSFKKQEGDAMNKEFERCCRLMAKLMEKYSSMVLRDIVVELQYRPERWIMNVDGKKSRFTTYVKRFAVYQFSAA